ncbi:MAG: 30S ribosome-binding factor RbfA [Candidatus Pacebacteria bacterium]|nr:30S ribosome-binding factor RbfA [Candidatus Paceibacterota bacterium]
MSKRVPQVNQLIKKELSQIIRREIEFPLDVLVTLTRAEASPDLEEIKIYISSLPEEKKKTVLQILNKNIYQLQQKLNRRLEMRPIPKIYFVEEKETVEAGKIEEILAKLKKGEE